MVIRAFARFNTWHASPPASTLSGRPMPEGYAIGLPPSIPVPDTSAPFLLIRRSLAGGPGLDGAQLGRRLLVNAFHLAGAAIPVPAVVEIALDLVQHRMNPGRSRIVLVLLDNPMRPIGCPGPSQWLSSVQVSWSTPYVLEGPAGLLHYTALQAVRRLDNPRGGNRAGGKRGQCGKAGELFISTYIRSTRWQTVLRAGKQF